LPIAPLLAIVTFWQFALPCCQHVAELGEGCHEELPTCHKASLPCCPFASKLHCQALVMPHCWQIISINVPHCHIASKQHGSEGCAMQNCHIAFLLTL